jgi:hypothetical protein
MSNDNNYMCLNDEYEYLKNEAEKQKNFFTNLITNIQFIEKCIISFESKFPLENEDNSFLNIFNLNNVSFYDKFQTIKNKFENDLINPLNDIYNNYNKESDNNINIYSDIKNNLLEEKILLGNAKKIL